MHTNKCANANPNSKCVCSCKGKLHGITHKQHYKQPTVDKYLGERK